MKLKNLCTSLASDNPPSKLELVSCKDADKHMRSFLERLKSTSGVREMLIRTDFLTSMSDENALEFFKALGDIPCLEHIVIQSSSRFHIESIPVLGLVSLRHATKLQRLGLDDMQVTATHKAFIAGLAIALQNHSSLREISMTNFFANDWANNESDVLDPMILALSTLPKLEKLEFSGCGSHALTGQDVRLLSPGSLSKLVGRPSLVHLQLSFLEMGDQHFEAVASQIRKNESLQTLALDYHKLNSDGFSHMMQAMETNSLIKSLSLRSLRDIGDQGYSEAMNMLQLNYRIENLSVTASPSQQAQIDLYLRMNCAGRALLREPTVSKRQWVDVLANNNDDIDVVRHLLQEIPGLCNGGSTTAESSDPAAFDVPATPAAA